MFKFKQSNAFTLVELLVAVSILVLVLGAAVSVEVSNLKLASRDEHYLQATNLAQKQLNLVKTVRDNNPLTTPFLNFPTTPTTTPKLSDIKHLTDPISGKWGLSDDPTTKTIEVNGVVYTIQIKANDVSNLTP